VSDRAEMALAAWLGRIARDGNAEAAAGAAAEAVAPGPWDIIRYAGFLARCQVATADADLGLTGALTRCPVDADRAVVQVPKGAPYPVLGHAGRRSRGAFDTPIEMARRVAAAAHAACDRTPVVGLDPACGTGSFLVAMSELGVREILGTDLDPVALAVARVAAPRARVSLADALRGGPKVDMVVGNPPFVPPERQDKAMRAELRRRFPWLEGRFDLVIPFAAAAVDRVRAGGTVGLVLPSPALVQPYGAVLRRRWVERHRIVEIAGPHPFPGASVRVALLVVAVDGGPAPLPAFGITPAEILRLAAVPFNPDLAPGDVEVVERVRAHSRPLSDLALVDTGLVAHSPAGGKRRLLHDTPGDGRVPYADAKDFFAGTRRWLDYRPDDMHRPKRPEMFEQPKIVLQRIRGEGTVKAAIDTSGVYVGHTCTVVVPRSDQISLERLLELIRSPLVDGLLRIESGERLDLYPKEVAGIPVPAIWWTDASVELETAWNLGPREVGQLTRLAARA
jgi:hypothetical protein